MTKPPLVPPEVDLRDYGFMPVEIGRLFGSAFHARSDDGAWRAGVTLWLKSYHQVPASSIPEDDVELACLAEFGRDVKSWLKVKQGALRGWVRCDDGRLYHPVVAEKALEGWIEKLCQRKSSAAGNAKRYGQTFDPEPFDASIESAIGMLSSLNPSSRSLAKRVPKASRRENVGSPDAPPVDIPQASQLKGQGREEEESSSLRSEDAEGRKPDLADAAKPKSKARGSRLPADWKPDDAALIFAAEKIGARAAEAELSKFLDYWTAKAGASAVKLDWGATWRNWVRTAAERGGHSPRGSPGHSRPYQTNGFLDAAMESQRDADRARNIHQSPDYPGAAIDVDPAR